MPSVLGRHAARALECKAIADAMAATWIPALTVTTTAADDQDIQAQKFTKIIVNRRRTYRSSKGRIRTLDTRRWQEDL